DRVGPGDVVVGPPYVEQPRVDWRADRIDDPRRRGRGDPCARSGESLPLLRAGGNRVPRGCGWGARVLHRTAGAGDVGGDPPRGALHGPASLDRPGTHLLEGNRPGRGVHGRGSLHWPHLLVPLHANRDAARTTHTSVED